MVDIFKQFQDLHQFQLKTFQRTLDDNFILNNDCKFKSVVLIPYFNVQKKGNIWKVTLLVAHHNFMTTTFLFSLTIIFFTEKTLNTLKLKLKLCKFLVKQLLKKHLMFRYVLTASMLLKRDMLITREKSLDS